MLQSGMRAPMGVKVKGPDLDTIERVALEIERYLKEVPSVEASAVIADRIVGKPYLEIDFDRKKIARYGLTIRARAGRGRSRRRRPAHHHDRRRPRALSRPRALHARAAQRDRDDGEDSRPRQGRLAHPARSAGRDQVRPRARR